MWPTSKEGNPNIYITAPFIMQFYIQNVQTIKL